MCLVRMRIRKISCCSLTDERGLFLGVFFFELRVDVTGETSGVLRAQVSFGLGFRVTW